MNAYSFSPAAITPANDAAMALAIFFGGSLSTNHDHHDMACVTTKQPWPTVVFDWGHVDFLPMVDEEIGLMTGVEVHAFNNETAGLFAGEAFTMFDHDDGAAALRILAARMAVLAMEDKA